MYNRLSNSSATLSYFSFSTFSFSAFNSGLILTFLLCLALLGCDYRGSNIYDGKADSRYKWHSLYREDFQTVAVPIFQNKDFTRGMEFRLTTAVVKSLEATTPYKVVSRERADTVLEGEITAVKINTISRDANSTLPQESLITMKVNFLWKDLRTGKILVQRKDFEQSATFYETQGESQSTGNQQAAEKLGLAIVQELQADW